MWKGAGSGRYGAGDMGVGAAVLRGGCYGVGERHVHGSQVPVGRDPAADDQHLRSRRALFRRIPVPVVAALQLQQRHHHPLGHVLERHAHRLPRQAHLLREAHVWVPVHDAPHRAVEPAEAVFHARAALPASGFGERGAERPWVGRGVAGERFAPCAWWVVGVVRLSIGEGEELERAAVGGAGAGGCEDGRGEDGAGDFVDEVAEGDVGGCGEEGVLRQGGGV